jgi:hypothetical protein
MKGAGNQWALGQGMGEAWPAGSQRVTIPSSDCLGHGFHDARGLGYPQWTGAKPSDTVPQ